MENKENGKPLVTYANEHYADLVGKSIELNDVFKCLESWVVEEIVPKIETWIINEIAPLVQDWVINEYSPTVEEWVKETFKEKLFKNKDSLKGFLKQSMNNEENK
jgi:hypothetical protein